MMIALFSFPVMYLLIVHRPIKLAYDLTVECQRIRLNFNFSLMFTL